MNAVEGKSVEAGNGHALQPGPLWRSGLPIFPCALKDKEPLTAHGFKDARKGRPLPGWPLCGVATGAMSGVDVLDVDPNGISWFNEMPLPATRHQLTRRGGLHLFFRHAPGLGSSGGRFAEGVDVRADGGYVIDWTLAGYDTLWPEKLAEWPAWLLPLAMKPKGRKHKDGADAESMSVSSKPPSKRQISSKDHYPAPTKDFKRRVQWNLTRLEKQAPGGRTHLLFEVACQFAEMTAEKLILPKVATHLMVEACRVNGLIKDYGKPKVLRTVADAYRIIEERELGDGEG